MINIGDEYYVYILRDNQIRKRQLRLKIENNEGVCYRCANGSDSKKEYCFPTFDECKNNAIKRLTENYQIDLLKLIEAKDD